MQRVDGGERVRGPHPGRPPLRRAAQGPGHRVHQHQTRDRRDGDRQLEADGRLTPSPHRRGVQGPRQPTNPAHGTSKEKSQIGNIR